MFTTLSKRLNPNTIGLNYPQTTDTFKNQIVSIVMDFIYSLDSGLTYGRTEEFADTLNYHLCTSLGTEVYVPRSSRTVDWIKGHLSGLKDEKFLDALDIFVQILYRDLKLRRYSTKLSVFDNINSIFKSNGVDLKIVEGYCIRVSEPIIQNEVIVPAFVELKGAGFTNAQNDLIEAFDHFKNGNNSAAIHSANKALESTIHYLLDKHNIRPDKDKMPNKLSALVGSSVIPPKYESVLNSLNNVLQFSGITRNNYGGHGSSKEIAVDDCYVQFAIDSAASAILFLVRLYNTSKK